MLATKLFIPETRLGLVHRPRLMERLNTALSCRLTLVSAPAGFGKTTILSQWISENKPRGRVAWVSLDEGDNDPTRFWDYFIAAIRMLQRDVGKTALEVLHSSQPDSIESVLISLINDLATTSDDLIVVLDDYHLIKFTPVHDGVAFFLEHAPPRFHLIIATRADPSLPLARLRGRGTMLEIVADDLRFTVSEAVMLIQEIYGTALGVEHVGALNEKTEGWAAGLKMAALALRGRQDIEAFLKTFTGNNRYILDYLMEEVLKQQPVHVRDFLLSTSVLEKLCADVCNHITGDTDAQDVIVKLEQSNLFIVPLDEERQWYRYHHLFAELLRHQLEITSGVEVVTRLHQRASQWYESRNLAGDAIHHASASQDWERAMQIIYEVSEERIKRGEIGTLLRWLSIVPEDVLIDNPKLYRQYCRALVGTNHPSIESALDNLEKASQGDDNLLGELAALRIGLLRQRGDIGTEALAEKALSLLATDNTVMRARAIYMLGMIKSDQYSFDDATKLLTDAANAGRQSGDYWTATGALQRIAEIFRERGNLHKAILTLKEAIKLGGDSPAGATPCSFLSRIMYELNQLDMAVKNATLSVKWSNMGGNVGPVYGYIYGSFTKLVQGDLTGAAEILKASDKAIADPTISPFFKARHAAGHVIFAIRNGDLDTASSWGKRLRLYIDTLTMDCVHIPARLLIAEGKKEKAADELRCIYEKMMVLNTHGLAITVRVCQALAASTETEALTYLSEALVNAEPEGYVRTFVDEGNTLLPVLQKALNQGIVPEYTHKLIDIIESEERQRRTSNGISTSSTLYSGPLSARELEILRLVAEGLSNQQIADRLVISLGTAKTHVHNIFEKLNAKTRTQCLARARMSGLI